MKKTETAENVRKKNQTWKLMKRNYCLYLFLVPAVVFIGVFCYAPMYGVLMAFQDYSPTKGIMGSTWVGMKWFRTFFDLPRFWQIVKNTLVVSLYSLVVGFPIPIVLALMINSVKNTRFKKLTQTVTYMPHFISTVVLCSMVIQFTNARTGLINQFLGLFGVPAVNYMAKKEYFYGIYVWSGVWQSLGYSSILYIAALSSVSPELHEAAIIDGAGIMKRIWHIDIPGILPTICIMLIMQCGRLLSMGYEKILLLQNPLNTVVSEVISSYSYNVSINAGTPQYSYAAAIDLFTAVINLVMLCLVNGLVKKMNQTSLW